MSAKEHQLIAVTVRTRSRSDRMQGTVAMEVSDIVTQRTFLSTHDVIGESEEKFVSEAFGRPYDGTYCISATAVWPMAARPIPNPAIPCSVLCKIA